MGNTISIEENYMALSEDVEITFKVIFGFLIALNLAGNVLVCLVVKRHQSMKTPMNYLLVNLAISDMIVGAFFIPRHLLLGFFEHPSGVTGDLLCKFVTYANLGWLAAFASVYTLVIIAWERYNAIMKPHSVAARFSTRKIKITVAACWVTAVVVTLTETIAIGYNDKIKSCDYFWTVAWNKVDAVFWLFGVGVLPTVIMSALYGRVIRSLWCSRNRIHDVSQRSLQKSRKRVTKAALTVTTVLFFCWMPNLLYYFITTFTPKTTSTADSLTSVSPFLYRVSHVLILLNSSVNPFVYAVQNRRFRTCMARILSCGRKKDDSAASVVRDETLAISCRNYKI